MKTSLALSLGFAVGAVAASVFLLFHYSDSPRLTRTGRDLSERIESLPVESICKALANGKAAGGDHLGYWANKTRYVVAGWSVDTQGVPVFYWTGADLPDDVPECQSLRH